MIMPLSNITDAHTLLLVSHARPSGSSDNTMPAWVRPSAKSAIVGGIELLTSEPGTPIIATG